jgi:hypothetical protein
MSEETAFTPSDDGAETTTPVAERNVTPHLAALGEKARDYARNARAENTQRAYDADWRQFSSWLRRQGFDPLPPNPQTVGLYLAACVDGGRGKEPISVATLERRLSGICWRYRQLGEPLDTSDRHISTVLAGIRRAHGRPPIQKEAIFTDDLRAMLATLDNDLRGLRDRRSWRSASPAACAARKSSVSIAARTNPRTGPAGSRFLLAPRRRPPARTPAPSRRARKRTALQILAHQAKAACC